MVVVVQMHCAAMDVRQIYLRLLKSKDGLDTPNLTVVVDDPSSIENCPDVMIESENKMVGMNINPMEVRGVVNHKSTIPKRGRTVRDKRRLR